MQCDAVCCSSLPYNAAQCDAVQCSLLPYNAVQYDAVQYDAVQCSLTPYNAVHSDAVQCTVATSLQCSAVESSSSSTSGQELTQESWQGDQSVYCILLHCSYCTVFHYTVLYCTSLHCTILYCKIPYCTARLFTIFL